MRANEFLIENTVDEMAHPKKVSPDFIKDYVDQLHTGDYSTDDEDVLEWIYRFDVYELKTIPIADLSLRFSGIDQSKVNHYSRYKTEYPPIVVDGDSKWIMDGYHRANAAAARGDRNIKAYIGVNQRQDGLDEMALKQFTPMGDFNKPGPFKGVDKRLVPHPTNQLKTARFFERTPYDFRLFFSNIPGTGKYSETGPVNAQQLQKMFGEQAHPIIEGSEDAITVVFVGNSGDSKVMMTPWIMAHRFGHAIQSGMRKSGGWSTWAEAEKHFFNTVNTMFEEYYGKAAKDQYGRPARSGISSNLTPEYNALFNAIGTQRSSRSGEIKRPYEFMYEIFAQYLGTGNVTFNPLPGNLGYGRQVFGNPTKYMNIKPEYRDESERQEATQTLANDMHYMFDDVLSSSVGQIFVM